MKLKIFNQSTNPTPQYSTVDSAGMDLRAFLPNGAITLSPLERKIIPTGLFMSIEDGHEGQIRPRSGLSIKQGLTVINAPGTIDADYRGEVGIPIINLSNELQTINDGDRVAQIVFAKYEKALINCIDVVEDLGSTERGAGGFGSTGVK